jgi:hypothetical protein
VAESERNIGRQKENLNVTEDIENMTETRIKNARSTDCLPSTSPLDIFWVMGVTELSSNPMQANRQGTCNIENKSTENSMPIKYLAI